MNGKPSKYGTGIYLKGKTLWVKFQDLSGKPHWKNSHSTKVRDAKKLRDSLKGDVANGIMPIIRADKVTFEEMGKDFINDYKKNGYRSLERAEISLKHLTKFFGGQRVISITKPRVDEYILERMEEDEVGNATINRELSALKRMFNIELEAKKIMEMPVIKLLKENNVREGFFELPEYLAVRASLPSRLKIVICIGYHRGVRRGEIITLEWDKHVDLMENRVNLSPLNTKDKKARFFYLDGELLKVIHEQYALRNKYFPDCPWVCFNDNGGQIKYFRDAWKSACAKAGYPDKLFHNLRRTGVRNMVRAGIPEDVAMRISGHKTRSVFSRYNITSERDLMDASKRENAYYEEQMKALLSSQTVVKMEGIERTAPLQPIENN